MSAIQRLLLAVYMSVRSDLFVPNALSEEDIRTEREREARLVYRYEVMFDAPPEPVYAIPRMRGQSVALFSHTHVMQCSALTCFLQIPI
jgi:hypothetical protein